MTEFAVALAPEDEPVALRKRDTPFSGMEGSIAGVEPWRLYISGVCMPGVPATDIDDTWGGRLCEACRLMRRDVTTSASGARAEW